MQNKSEEAIFIEPREGHIRGPLMTLLEDHSIEPTKGYRSARLPMEGCDLPDTSFFEMNFCDEHGVMKEALILVVTEKRKTLGKDDHVTLFVEVMTAIPVQRYELSKQVIVKQDQCIDWDRLHCNYQFDEV